MQITNVTGKLITNNADSFKAVYEELNALETAMTHDGAVECMNGLTGEVIDLAEIELTKRVLGFFFDGVTVAEFI